MSNHAAGTPCSASVRLGFSGPTPFFESTYYYHGLLVVAMSNIGDKTDKPSRSTVTTYIAHNHDADYYEMRISLLNGHDVTVMLMQEVSTPNITVLDIEESLNVK